MAYKLFPHTPSFDLGPKSNIILLQNQYLYGFESTIIIA